VYCRSSFRAPNTVDSSISRYVNPLLICSGVALAGTSIRNQTWPTVPPLSSSSATALSLSRLRNDSFKSVGGGAFTGLTEYFPSCARPAPVRPSDNTATSPTLRIMWHLQKAGARSSQLGARDVCRAPSSALRAPSFRVRDLPNVERADVGAAAA